MFCFQVPIQLALKIHREQQSAERQKLAKHRKKCLDNKDQYLGLVIDGMDQKKTLLPHFLRPPKNLKEENFVQLHVVGALIFNGIMTSRVFINFPNLHNDPNLTVTVIQKILTEWEGDLPGTLYVQLDNTARENKNQVLIAYLSMLVEKKVFKKVKLGFLLVGHTHDQIDQMFSRFSVKLAKKSAFDLLEICEVLKESYEPQPEVHVLKGTYDFRQFATGGDSGTPSFIQLNDHSFQHQFKMKQKDGETRLWCKKYSNTESWHPIDGLKFLSFVPQQQIVPSSYMLLVSTNESAKALKENRSINYMQCLAEIKDNIDASHVYFPACSMEWWSAFFEEQKKLIEGVEDDTIEVINLDPFFWPVHQSNIISSENVVEGGIQGTQLTEELERLVHGETREAYVGARKTTQRRQQEKEMWEGNVNELIVGVMIAVLASDDESGCPFWIAKVIKIHEENQRIHSIDVHWYKAVGKDAISSRYYPEVIKVTKKKKKGSKERRIDNLNLEDVEILVYGFSLKKSGHLRQQTIKILMEKVEGL